MRILYLKDYYFSRHEKKPHKTEEYFEYGQSFEDRVFSHTFHTWHGDAGDSYGNVIVTGITTLTKYTLQDV